MRGGTRERHSCSSGTRIAGTWIAVLRARISRIAASRTRISRIAALRTTVLAAEPLNVRSYTAVFMRFSLLAAVFFLASVFFGAAKVSAAVGGNDSAYSYTVTLFAGNQGVFTGTDGIEINGSGKIQPAGDGTIIRITGLEYGDRITVRAQSGMVQLNDDSRCYVRGIRQSGRDNNTVGTPSFVVEGDQEYVIAYGIRGNMVEYRVAYEDADGNALLPEESFYGVVGDRPVVAFRYVDGYQPQAYNLTGTLSANEAENRFTFVYTPRPEPAEPGQDTPGTGDGAQDNDGQNNETENNAQGAGTGTGTAAGTGTGTGTGAENAPGTGDGAQTGQGTGAGNAPGTGDGAETGQGTGAENEPGTGTGDDGETAVQEPEELTDIDDERTPLADTELDGEKESGSSGVFSGKLPLFLGISAVALVALAGLGILLVRRRR